VRLCTAPLFGETDHPPLTDSLQWHCQSSAFCPFLCPQHLDSSKSLLAAHPFPPASQGRGDFKTGQLHIFPPTVIPSSLEGFFASIPRRGTVLPLKASSYTPSSLAWGQVHRVLAGPSAEVYGRMWIFFEPFPGWPKIVSFSKPNGDGGIFTRQGLRLFQGTSLASHTERGCWWLPPASLSLPDFRSRMTFLRRLRMNCPGLSSFGVTRHAYPPACHFSLMMPYSPVLDTSQSSERFEYRSTPLPFR